MNFSIEFSKELSKYRNKNFSTSKKLKILGCTANDADSSEYIARKSKLDKSYEEKVNCIRIRSKFDWYEYGEKFTKFFLNKIR